ncbi:MAG: hypothetical protein RLZZ28_2468 [Bacteroidota bacterium]
MTLSLAFSPCPNDTFIFDALVNKKIDTGNFSFEVMLEDVQTLNEQAIAGKPDISKISYGVLPRVLKNYTVLNAGSALGMGVGPLLITRKDLPVKKEVNEMTIAIPGINTTAHMLFSLAFPNAGNKKFMVFHEIEDAVLSGQADAGVIIHENRFTYSNRGLIKIMDLGEYWESTTKVPIPLGGIVIKRSIDSSIRKEVDLLIKKSLVHAFKQYPLLPDYVRAHSREMSEDVMRKHIDLYVNEYSIDLGEEGKKAIEKLLEVSGLIMGTVPTDASALFS